MGSSASLATWICFPVWKPRITGGDYQHWLLFCSQFRLWSIPIQVCGFCCWNKKIRCFLVSNTKVIINADFNAGIAAGKKIIADVLFLVFFRNIWQRTVLEAIHSCLGFASCGKRKTFWNFRSTSLASLFSDRHAMQKLQFPRLRFFAFRARLARLRTTWRTHKTRTRQLCSACTIGQRKQTKNSVSSKQLPGGRNQWQSCEFSVPKCFSPF